MLVTSRNGPELARCECYACARVAVIGTGVPRLTLRNIRVYEMPPVSVSSSFSGVQFFCSYEEKA